MKSGIHPRYEPVSITCACGNVIETRSTKAGITVEICSNCHPFFTGKQKIVDAAGRVERFTARYKNVRPVEKKPAQPAPAARQVIPKVKPVVPLAPPPKPAEGGPRGARPGGGRPGAGRPGGGAGRPGGRGGQPGGAPSRPGATASRPGGTEAGASRSQKPAARSEKTDKPGTPKA